MLKKLPAAIIRTTFENFFQTSWNSNEAKFRSHLDSKSDFSEAKLKSPNNQSTRHLSVAPICEIRFEINFRRQLSSSCRFHQSRACHRRALQIFPVYAADCKHPRQYEVIEKYLKVNWVILLAEANFQPNGGDTARKMSETERAEKIHQAVQWRRSQLTLTPPEAAF